MEPRLYDPNNEHEVKEAMTHSAAQIRGYVLQVAIEIEARINIYLSELLCSSEDHIGNMQTVILSRMQLRNKGEAFFVLIKKYNNQFYEDNKEVLETLSWAIKERNIFAHTSIDFSAKAVNKFITRKYITLIYVKDGLTPRTIDQEQCNEVVRKMIVLSNVLAALIDKDLPPGVAPEKSGTSPVE